MIRCPPAAGRARGRCWCRRFARSDSKRGELSSLPLVPPISVRKVAVCVAVAAALLLIPVAGDFTHAVRFTAFIGLLMALLWLTEAMPMGMTALIPLVAFPLAGVNSKIGRASCRERV